MRRRFIVAVAAALATAAGIAAALPARAVPSSGTAVIVDGAGSSTPRLEGGSATPFSLKLPSPAECPRDSADGNYRIQGFVVPTATDPGAMRWNDIAPVVKDGYALYDLNTNPYSEALTAKATKPKGPGPIINIPSFSFGVFLPPGRLPPGTYHIGIACSLYNVIDRYWVTDIAISRDAADKPAELHWKALEAPPARSSSGTSVWLIVVPLALVAVAAAVGTRRRSRSHRAAPR